MFLELMKFFVRPKNTKDVAKDRLKLVLIHDRAGVSPELLDVIRGEIIKTISIYMDIDMQELDIQLTKTKSEESQGLVPALVANIPIKNLKDYSKTNELVNN